MSVYEKYSAAEPYRHSVCSLCGHRLRPIGTRLCPTWERDGWALLRDDGRLVAVHENCFISKVRGIGDVEAEEGRLFELRRQIRAIKRIATVIDTPMCASDAAKLLPWRPHASALLRMATTSRISSVLVDGATRLRGRDLMPLVAEWVKTGSYPWCDSDRSRMKRREEKSA